MNIPILGGGSGFVGTRLTEELIKDHHITHGNLAKSETYSDLWLWKHCDIYIDDDLRPLMQGQNEFLIKKDIKKK